MATMKGKWILKDSQSLMNGTSGELQVKVTGAIGRTVDGINVVNEGITAAMIAAAIAGDGLAGGNGSALSVNAGDGIDIVSDAVAVDVTDFIDTAAGLTEDASNNIQVNLASTGGLEFSSGAIQLKSSVAGDGLAISSGVLSVTAGDGIDIVTDAVAVDVTDLIDTAAGLKEDASNNIQINLDSVGGLEFNSGAVRLKSGVAGAGLTMTDGVIDVVGGNGITVSSNNVDLGSLTANWSTGGTYTITGLPTPTNDSDVATKSYVDATAQGLIVKDAVRAASTTEIAATYAGAGKTLTANANGAAVIDGVTLALGDRVLIKDQTTNPEDNGIYTVTTLGDAGAPFVLTRAVDFDGTPVSETSAGAFTFVTEGTVNADAGWVMTTDDPVTIGTTELAFAQFSGAGQVLAGAGLTKTGNTIDIGTGDGITVNSDSITVKLDSTTLSKSGDGLKVADAGITATQIATSVAGDGLAGGAGTALSVNAGDGIDIVSDAVAVDVTDFIDTAAGLKEDASNNIQVNLDADGGMEFNSGAIRLKAAVAGDGLSHTSGVLAVVAGDGIDIVTDAVAVDVTDFIDTAAGLKEDASNNIQVNLDATGGLEFSSGAIKLKADVAGDGLAYTAGVLSINTGNGIAIVSDAVALGSLTANWDVGGTYTITGLPAPTNNSDAVTKLYVDTAVAGVNNQWVDTFTLVAGDITAKYVTLTSVPALATSVICMVKGAPVQFYGSDFAMDNTNTKRLSWDSLGMDGILEAGDSMTVLYAL